MAGICYCLTAGKRFARAAFDNSNVLHVNGFFRTSFLITKSLKDHLKLGMNEIAQGSYKHKFLCEKYSNCSRHHSSSPSLDRYRSMSCCNHAYRLPYVSGKIMKMPQNSPYFKQSVGKYFDLVARPMRDLILTSSNNCSITEDEIAFRNKTRGNHVKFLHRMSFLGPFYMDGINRNKNTKIKSQEECLDTILQSRQKSNSRINEDMPLKWINSKNPVGIKDLDKNKPRKSMPCKDLNKGKNNKNPPVTGNTLKNEDIEKNQSSDKEQKKNEDMEQKKNKDMEEKKKKDIEEKKNKNMEEKKKNEDIEQNKDKDMEEKKNKNIEEKLKKRSLYAKERDIVGYTELLNSTIFMELSFDQKSSENKNVSKNEERTKIKVLPKEPNLDTKPSNIANHRKEQNFKQSQHVRGISINERNLQMKDNKKAKDKSILQESQESHNILNDLDLILKSHVNNKRSSDIDFTKQDQVFLQNSAVESKNKAEINQSYESLMGNINQAVLEDFKKLPIPDNKIQATYVWVVENILGVKERILHEPPQSVNDLPEWSGCNMRKEIEFSLIPKQFYNNPFKPNNGNVLVLCDTYNLNEKHLSNNKRANCLETIDRVREMDPWFGFSQEYVIINRAGKPLGKNAVGLNLARDLADAHASACLYAGVAFYGMNLQRAPGKWEYQIGPGRGLHAADDLWISRFILKRIAEKMGLIVSFNSKIIPKLNLRTRVTFSTEAMRGEDGITAIKKTICNLEKHHARDAKIYNCKLEQFSFALGEKSASVRIPQRVARNGFGYVEDCRPDGNSDPYDIVQTILISSLDDNSKPKPSVCNGVDNTRAEVMNVKLLLKKPMK